MQESGQHQNLRISGTCAGLRGLCRAYWSLFDHIGVSEGGSIRVLRQQPTSRMFDLRRSMYVQVVCPPKGSQVRILLGAPNQALSALLATVPELSGRARKWSFDFSSRMQSPKQGKGRWDSNGTVVGPVWDSCLDLISANDHIPLGQRTRCFLGGGYTTSSCIPMAARSKWRNKRLVTNQLKDSPSRGASLRPDFQLRRTTNAPYLSAALGRVQERPYLCSETAHPFL